MANTNIAGTKKAGLNSPAFSTFFRKALFSFSFCVVLENKLRYEANLHEPKVANATHKMGRKFMQRFSSSHLQQQLLQQHFQLAELLSRTH